MRYLFPLLCAGQNISSSDNYTREVIDESFIASNGEFTMDDFQFTRETNVYVAQSMNPPLPVHRIRNLVGWSRMSFDDNTGQYFTLPDEKKHIFACGSTGMWVIEFDFVHDDGTIYKIHGPVSIYNFTLQQDEVSRMSIQDRKKLDMLVNEDMISSDCTVDNKKAVFDFAWAKSPEDKDFVPMSGHWLNYRNETESSSPSSTIEPESSKGNGLLIAMMILGAVLAVLCGLVGGYCYTKKKMSPIPALEIPGKMSEAPKDRNDSFRQSVRTAME